jgi:hypothetical protein
VASHLTQGVATSTAQGQLGRQEDESIGGGGLHQLVQGRALAAQLVQQRQARTPLTLVEAVEQTSLLPRAMPGDAPAGSVLGGQQ